MEDSMSSVTAGSLLLSTMMGLGTTTAPPGTASVAPPQVESACALITTEEAAAALHIGAAEAKSSDSPEMKERGQSRCVVVLVSAPTMDGTKSLMAKALARLP
jgi:hypothetical protein